MALASLLFAAMNLLARLASASASWSSVAASRAFMGAAVAFAVARARRAPLRATDRRLVFWRSVFGTVSMAATFYALSSRTLSLGDTATLLNLAPVFLAVLAPIVLRERTSLGVVLAIALALTGVLFVVRPSFLFGGAPAIGAGAHAGPSAGATAAVALLAALSTSIAMTLLRRAGQKESAEAIALHFSLFAAGAMTLVSLADFRLPTLRDGALMIAAGACAGVAQLAMTRAYALEQAARVSAMSYLSVVATALVGGAALGERPTATAALGMSLVVVGGVVSTLARRTESTSASG